ncbi:MAG: DUF3568 family protein [Deltaproteobacteria bacterium]|nr:DUF3568 family protein [Deltaproteobacteria bacterium]
MRVIRPFARFLLPFFLFLSGCAAPVALLPVVLPGVITGAGAGISYSFTNIAYKTLTYAIEDVDRANRDALERMSIRVVKRKVKKNSIKIKAETRKLAIYITMESMTPTLTRIKVNAKRLLIFKDKTTAFEVIYQTERSLLEAPPKAPSEAPPMTPAEKTDLG